jgi:cytochrome b
MGAAAEAAGPRMIRVWDPLVRVLHWTLAATVLGAYFIERPRDLHEALGYLALGAVALRLVWGVIGTRHARFADFVPSPGRLLGHLRDMLGGREHRHVGHNPVGAVMILALLSLVALTGITGWMMGTDALFGEDWIEDLHEAAATATLALVPLHVAGVLWSGLRHHENLVRAMITGDKRG